MSFPSYRLSVISLVLKENKSLTYSTSIEFLKEVFISNNASLIVECLWYITDKGATKRTCASL